MQIFNAIINGNLGEVIRGWDEGVAQVSLHRLFYRSSFDCTTFFLLFFCVIVQLSVGERAKLVCSPDYAYGARGHPGIIPPNATLTFDVELIRVE